MIITFFDGGLEVLVGVDFVVGHGVGVYIYVAARAIAVAQGAWWRICSPTFTHSHIQNMQHSQHQELSFFFGRRCEKSFTINETAFLFDIGQIEDEQVSKFRQRK